jgi:Xaa-Pro aminopeptidase
VVCDSSTDEPFIHEGAASVVRAAGLERARLGLAGRDALSVQLWELVRSALPDVVFVPADDLTSQARRRKSPAEMQLIREVGRVADGAMEAMLAASVPGATERDAVGAALSALVAAGGMPYSLAFETGPAAARYCPSTLPPWSERAMRAGDLWRVDMAGSLGGYIFDFARTTVVGSEPSAIQRQLIETAIAAVETVIESIEPGRVIGEAVGRGRRVLSSSLPEAPPATRHDYPHLGHLLGLGFEDVWLYEDERRPFEAGWYVAVEAVAASKEHGFAMFEQNLLVTEEGVELVTRCPARPWETN